MEVSCASNFSLDSSAKWFRGASRYPMMRAIPVLSAYGHFATMVFPHLTYCESLRDIEVWFNTRRTLLYHAGIQHEGDQHEVASLDDIPV